MAEAPAPAAELAGRRVSFPSGARHGGASSGGPMTAAQAMPVHMQRNGFDPVPELAELRAGPGVERVRTMFGMDAWLVTRYADVREVLSDPARFSNSHVMSAEARPPGLEHVSPEEIERRRAGNLLAHDPPEHTRLRRLLTPEFTVRREAKRGTRGPRVVPPAPL